MDFGIGFLSTNIMLPILDFFYGIVPSYGFAIIALTLAIRFAVYPLSASSIRNMRRTRIAQPVMQKRVKEIQERYKDDPTQQQQAMSEVYKEFGNPLAGCFPILLQMPILFALFATLRGSPFTNINYTADVQIFPKEQIELIQPQVFSTKTQNIYIDNGVHTPIAALLPAGNKLVVGQKSAIEFQTPDGKSLGDLVAQNPESNIKPTWKVTKGAERVNITPDGTVEALAPGEATIQGTIPGIAANTGFFFIQALGRVGATGENGKIHWDIVGMVIFFGLSTYVSQNLTNKSPTKNSDANAQQQQMISKFTPILFSGMFLFFPLPAGVLMYIVVANIFQTVQTFFLMKEPLPENLQKLVEQQEKEEKRKEGRDKLPFERKRSKKKEKTSG
ncbi:membrane protein insertase YidC [Lusitaniella coriacea LEGE 07157]|uniref:Membrane protein insertase YidC n=1 Tax=Lusitaniella coriacea LEGE 07157 TaxID=945747 RepID=A0A8J7B8T0_9CYAN|nr:membrane protein insertase YidC [Lusitaniella coriacea]MBE9115093.1 membrane protein insertase YidC [Lusitaniella coriacea LEGE 07157]